MRAAPFLTERWSPLLPARPSCSDGERLYVVGEHYYWRVRLPFSLAAAPESRLVASLTTRYDTPQLAVRPDRAPREDSELSFRLASQARASWITNSSRCDERIAAPPLHRTPPALVIAAPLLKPGPPASSLEP